MDIDLSKHYKAIKELVPEDIYERIEKLQPQTKVDFSNIFGMGPVTLNSIEEHVNAIENNYLSKVKVDLEPEMKLRLEVLRDRLINISQTNNIIWNSKETKNRLLDLSKLKQSSIDSIYELIENLSKKVRLEVENLSTEDNKEFFLSIYRENNRQKEEKGRSILYIAPAIFLGKTKVENKDVKLRAPLFLFPVKLTFDKLNDNWNLSFDSQRDVITNPFVERYILSNEREYQYDYEATLTDNIDRLSNLGKKMSNQYRELKQFDKVTMKDPWGYAKGEFAIQNNLLLGLFSDFSSEIESELEHLIYNMDSTPTLNKFLSNADYHSREEVVSAKKKLRSKINDDSNLSYSNTLNGQQLRALKIINDKNINGLTIWGPPGTGKSETIISLIENAVANNQRVMVVSEKQAALDVIKNRLKLLKDNSIMLSDIKDKKSFYRQLDKMVSKENYQYSNVSKQIKSKLKSLYNELDLIYEKFELNNKDIFGQIRELLNSPLYETPLSKRMQYEDQFFHFRNISLETFNNVYNFIESIDSRERLKLFITVSNNYFGKFNSFKDIEDFVANKIRQENDSIKLREELLATEHNIRMTLDSFSGPLGIVKKNKYKNELIEKYSLEKQDFEDLKLGTFTKVQRFKIQKSNEYKDSLIRELEWVESRKADIDICLSMDIHNLNLIKLIDVENIHESKESIKINLIKRLLKSDKFKDKMHVLINYDSKLKEISDLQKEFNKLSIDSIKKGIDNSIDNVSINMRENNISKLTIKKRPVPIRKFMNDYSIEMKNLVKVWLLQPEVVPSLFELTDQFDLIIFDEASQIFLERALPAIARAKKIVVLGDEKQLSPSSFFAGRIMPEESEDEIIESNESLLTYSRSKLPEIMLKKHYRSKDINLIKFSNRKYYNDGLDFINDNSYNDSSISYEFIEESNYSNGLNKKEADRVIELLTELKDDSNTNSIGVITSNSKQEIYIYNKLLTHNYEVYEWMKANNSFIKSIENVQGDEKDIIIFSTTYGPEEGIQKINFGPINQANGSNRINVAVTRAKKKMIVISSIDLEQAAIKVKTSIHQGPKDFIDYIRYARLLSDQGSIELGNEVNSFNDSFKNEVLNRIKSIIENTNIDIKVNYEGLGLKIDIVLFNKKTNKNLLAILLDSPVNQILSREKDYLSQAFLNLRGWKTYRIWSPVWWTNNNKEIFRLEETINKLIGDNHE